MTLTNLLKIYAKKTKTPLQLKFLYEFGKSKTIKNKIEQSKFLHEELSIRLSHRVFNLMKLPYGLPIVPEIKGIIDLYCDSFQRIKKSPKPNKYDEVIKFTDLLSDIKNRHNNLENTMAEGLLHINDPLIDYRLINNELNKFFMSRIGIRTLISQQIETINNDSSIFNIANFYNIIHNSIDNVTSIAEFIYDDVPKVIVNCDENICIPYIDSHLYYIFTEILKNSFVAHNKINSNDKIKIDVSEGKEDIIVRISDKGGGFKYKEIENVLSFSYSTNKIDFSSLTDRSPVISGYGFGLPMSRLYSNYFGGDICINPIEKVGTDVFIYLNKLGYNSEKLY